MHLVEKHRIKYLVIGAVDGKAFDVIDNAPPYCHIWHIYNDPLQHTRSSDGSVSEQASCAGRISQSSSVSYAGNDSAEESRPVNSDESRQIAGNKALADAVALAGRAERLHKEEIKRRETKEEELKKTSDELSVIVAQKCSLEVQLEESNFSLIEAGKKLLSAVELLQKYKTEHDEMHTKMNNALEEAKNLRKQLAEGTSRSNSPLFSSVFTMSDLEEATNNFDPRLKVGEGGYGNIYKGFLHHTEVAIKILHNNSTQGPREFIQEVEVLSKMRHPNLVALIGACPETWALVYEYLPGGNLEDRLTCKDNALPLSWQTRIRIATELCSALIFLHSSPLWLHYTW